MSLNELTVSAFAEALASSAATPGGGSASALSGALAASLVAMVARNPGAPLDEVAAEADLLRDELLDLVDEDSAAFDRVMAAFRLPKETPEEKTERSRQIQEGYKAAVEPPLLVCGHAVRVLALAGRVAAEGNSNAASDAGVAALLAGSALEGAAMNVEINLGSIKDEVFRTERAATVDEARAEGARLRDAALVAVRTALG